MSGSELFDLLRPAIYVVSAVISAYILFSAQKRHSLYKAFLWAGATFMLPLVIGPVYGVMVLLSRTSSSLAKVGRRFSVALIYLLAVLGVLAAIQYFDSRSIDAHLSRAIFARVKNDPLTAVQEYREVLKREDIPHNHALLAAALEEAGLNQEAINEFRLAERGGEPDDTIHYRLALLLEKTDQRDESLQEFRKFALSAYCLQVDSRCDDARYRTKQLANKP